MIGIRGVTHAQEKTQQYDCEQGGDYSGVSIVGSIAQNLRRLVGRIATEAKRGQMED